MFCDLVRGLMILCVEFFGECDGEEFVKIFMVRGVEFR